jgi:hypothetical protein
MNPSASHRAITAPHAGSAPSLQPVARSGSHAHARVQPATVFIEGRAMQAQPTQQQQGGGGKGDSPAPAPTPEPAPPPVIEDTEGKQQDAADSLRRRQGALSTNVTGPTGAGAPTTSGKTLLGA